MAVTADRTVLDHQPRTTNSTATVNPPHTHIRKHPCSPFLSSILSTPLSAFIVVVRNQSDRSHKPCHRAPAPSTRRCVHCAPSMLSFKSYLGRNPSSKKCPLPPPHPPVSLSRFPSLAHCLVPIPGGLLPSPTVSLYSEPTSQTSGYPCVEKRGREERQK